MTIKKLCLLVLCLLTAGCLSSRGPLTIVVMDPLSAPLACACVKGYAQRDYEKLAAHLREQLQQDVEVAYSETLAPPLPWPPRDTDLAIGKYSVVAHDAKGQKLQIRTLAMLKGLDGTVTQTGLFVVKTGTEAKTLEDLAGSSVLFGPAESDEKNAAALAALEAFALPAPDPLPIARSCNTAALAVAEDEAHAAVISSYAMPLLEGCGAVDKGVLRILARTDPVPFITVFASDRVAPGLATRIVRARDYARFLLLQLAGALPLGMRFAERCGMRPVTVHVPGRLWHRGRSWRSPAGSRANSRSF